MKLSDKILEEFQAQVKYYEDVIRLKSNVGAPTKLKELLKKNGLLNNFASQMKLI